MLPCSGHRSLISIQFCLVPPLPSAFFVKVVLIFVKVVLESCCPHFWLQISSGVPSSVVALFFRGLVVSTAKVVWQCCRHFFARVSKPCNSISFFWSVSVLVPDKFLSVSHCCWFCLASVRPTLTILHRHLLMKTCILFTVLCMNVKDSYAYTKSAFTLELNILILVAFPVILDFHSLSVALKLFYLFPM